MMNETTSRMDEIVEQVQEYVDADRDEVESFINADWPNSDEHAEWLATASVEEIADWVIAGMR